MRIAIFSDNFYPELSGISDSIITTAKELARRGHTIRFFVPQYAPRDYRKIGLPPGEQSLHERISVVRFSSFPYGGPSGQARIVIPTGLRARFVREFRPDILHSNLIFGVGLEGLAASRMLKRPLVGTNHTPLAEFMKYSPVRAAWITSLLLSYDSWYYNRCTFVSSPATAIFEEMTRHGFRTPHAVVSNPVDCSLFHPIAPGARETLKKEFGFSPFTILYAGRLAPEKRIGDILDAFAARLKDLPDATVAIVGKGPSETVLRTRAKELGISDRVRFLGFLKDTAILARAYGASDVFAIMSPAETQSIVAMQALASGIPAIGSRAWGIGEYLGKAEQLTVASGDVQGLATHFVTLFRNSTLRAELGAKGRTFTETISIPAIATQWEQIYAEAGTSYHKKMVFKTSSEAIKSL